MGINKVSKILRTRRKQAEMRNRDLPVFPITKTIQEENPDGTLKVTQETVGGFTKFEQGAFLIAQGLCESGLYTPDEIGGKALQITEDIFDKLEKIQ